MIRGISPIAFTIPLGSFKWPVYWYGLFFAAAFVWGIAIFRYMYRQEGQWLGIPAALIGVYLIRCSRPRATIWFIGHER